MNRSPSSMGWPASPGEMIHDSTILAVSFRSAWCRSSYPSALGQTHCTESGVSPQPSALRPAASATTTRIRAHVTSVVISGPNFNGILEVIGRK